MAKTLLLADDSVTIQKVVGITFANEDVEIVTVDNGADALTRAHEIRPDVVLADVGMPGLDGYALCSALKSDPQLREIPVLLLTGTFETFDETRMREAGADAHVAKPFEAQMLVDQVHALLDRRHAPAAAPELEDPGPVPAPLTAAPVQAPAAPIEPDFSFDDLDFAAPVSPSDATQVMSSAEPEPEMAFAAAPEPTFAARSTPVAAAPILNLPTVTAEAEDALYGDSARAQAPAPVAAPLPPADPEAVDEGLPMLASAHRGERASEISGSAIFGEPLLGESEDSVTPFVEVPPSDSAAIPVDPPAPPPTGLSEEDLAFAAAQVEEPPPSLAPAPAETMAPPPPRFDEVSERIAEDTTTPEIGTSESVLDLADSDVIDEPEFLADRTVDDVAPLIDASPLEEEPVPLPTPTAPAAVPHSEPAPQTRGSFELPDFETPPFREPAPLARATPEPELEPVVEPPAAVALDPPSPTPTVEIDPARVHDAMEKVAWEAFGPLSEQLVSEVVARLEAIAWEVVPKLAERLIREEIERLKGDA